MIPAAREATIPEAGVYNIGSRFTYQLRPPFIFAGVSVQRPSCGSPLMRLCIIAAILVASLQSSSLVAQPLVAETPPLTPAEQITKFHLPPGFEIQLVAQEPDVHKPMNMKFDAHGSLWVTHSLEYPFPAANDDAARDAITIFSNFAPTGKAQTIRRFAEHLNIPIGVLPLADSVALAWSIPNIYRLIDTNGDGIADEKQVMFGPFGVIDTHGDQNAFTRWIDGWIYANHGFSNDSHVKIGGTGPDVLHMNSGNTYRFRPDGSAIEQFSWGQVNPFGLSFDSLGNLFSADCHSCAVTMLLREGYYQSFGKPHDGLGYAPEITHIDHGGTGIAGVVYSTLPQFPAEYRDVLFVGNVITNRIHCDRLKWTGSTPVVTKVEDFLTCDDPWFRPVDIQAGPDGALYIADFYNCIIGHYEVPLTHPKRDRERGRIWRVVYKGQQDDQLPTNSRPMPDLEKLSAPQIFALLRHSNLTVRTLATNYLLDRFPKDAAQLSGDLLSATNQTAPTDANEAIGVGYQTAHAIWLLQRTSGIRESVAERLVSLELPSVAQVHLVKALGETVDWQPWHFSLVRSQLQSADPFVRRAAAEALAKHPAAKNLPPLLKLLSTTDGNDTQLYHQIRIALRDQLRSPEIAASVVESAFPPAIRAQLIEFAATAPTGPAATLIVNEALHGTVSDELLVKALPAAAKYIDAVQADAVVPLIEKRFAANATQQISLLRALAEGLNQRALPLSEQLRTALTERIKAVLSDQSNSEWFNTPFVGEQSSPSPWGPQLRNYRDGTNNAVAISSLAVGGERLGGTLHSPDFDLPAKLGFWMCGHNGSPNAPDRKLNYVRLLLADGSEVARSYPPRSDTAEHYEWDLSPYAGSRGHVEVVDGITDIDGFAWIAVSGFNPAVITLPDHPIGEKGSGAAELYRLAGKLKLVDLKPYLQRAAADDPNLNARLASIEALAAFDPQLGNTPADGVVKQSRYSSGSAPASGSAIGSHRPPRGTQRGGRSTEVSAGIGGYSSRGRSRRSSRNRRKLFSMKSVPAELRRHSSATPQSSMG